MLCREIPPTNVRDLEGSVCFLGEKRSHQARVCGIVLYEEDPTRRSVAGAAIRAGRRGNRGHRLSAGPPSPAEYSILSMNLERSFKQSGIPHHSSARSLRAAIDERCGLRGKANVGGRLVTREW
jgi:hypothetical protein